MRARGGEPSACQTRIEAAEEVGRVNPYHAVEEANWRVSFNNQWRGPSRLTIQVTYLSAGRRPKKAIKVRAETVRTKRAMSRRLPIWCEDESGVERHSTAGKGGTVAVARAIASDRASMSRHSKITA